MELCPTGAGEKTESFLLDLTKHQTPGQPCIFILWITMINLVYFFHEITSHKELILFSE